MVGVVGGSLTFFRAGLDSAFLQHEAQQVKEHRGVAFGVFVDDAQAFLQAVVRSWNPADDGVDRIAHH